MRRSTLVIVLLCLFILWLGLVAYLAGSPEEPAGVPDAATVPEVNAGISSGTRPSGEMFSLEEANRLLTDLPLEQPNLSVKKVVYYIQAEDVDEDGRSPSWIFGVTGPQETPMLLTYSGSGWTIIPWRGSFSYSALDLNTTVMPGTLMQEHGDLLAAAAGGRRQVELYDGMYHVTIADGSEVRTYTFDAMSGTLVEPHEG